MAKKLALLLLAVLLSVVFAARLPAQAPPQTLTFEVASVRPTRPGGTSATLQREPGGNFSATNQTLRALISVAYRVQSLQIVGAPDWISLEPWDIVARAGRELPPVQPGQTPPDLLMLRALLEDRFRLVARAATQEIPIYALVVARNDGRLGGQIRRPPDDYCAQLRQETALRTAPPPPQNRECGVRGDGMSGPNAIYRGAAVSLADFARVLSPQVQRIVVDRTGLTGEWDFDLRFTPPRFAASPTPSLADSPSIFTALQEQLGLKLEATTGPVELLIIQRVERPSQN